MTDVATHLIRCAESITKLAHRIASHPKAAALRTPPPTGCDPLPEKIFDGESTIAGDSCRILAVAEAEIRAIACELSRNLEQCCKENVEQFCEEWEDCPP